MTIDNDALIDAVTKAYTDDNVVNHMIAASRAAGTQQDDDYTLKAEQGAATRSLLDSLAKAAKYSNIHAGRHITPQTYISKNGKLCEIPSIAGPVFELTVMRDTISPYSFFVRGTYVDPTTRATVRLFDSIWCLFDKDKYTTDQVESATLSDITQYIADGECDTTVNPASIDYSKYTVRRADYQRLDFTAGIIYHKTYINGKEMPFGKWQLHT